MGCSSEENEWLLDLGLSCGEKRPQMRCGCGRLRLPKELSAQLHREHRTSPRTLMISTQAQSTVFH